MRRFLMLAVLGLALVVGCAGSQGVSKDTTIKCPSCGVEFPAGEGMEGNH